MCLELGLTAKLEMRWRGCLTARRPRRALDQQLNENGFQSERYRSLLLAIIQAEQQKYDVPPRGSGRWPSSGAPMARWGGRRWMPSSARTLDHTYRMATRANLKPGGDREDLYLYMMKSNTKRGLGRLAEASSRPGTCPTSSKS